MRKASPSRSELGLISSLFNHGIIFCFKMKANSTPIFVYGTLSSPNVVQTLLGKTIPTPFRPAWIENYSRHPVRGHLFPGMIPNQGRQVHGCILENLSALDIRLLDWFEGEEYERETIQIYISEASNVEKSSLIHAETYIWKPHLLNELDQSKEWSYDNFCKKHLDWYLKNTVQPCREEMVSLGLTKKK